MTLIPRNGMSWLMGSVQEKLENAQGGPVFSVLVVRTRSEWGPSGKPGFPCRPLVSLGVHEVQRGICSQHVDAIDETDVESVVEKLQTDLRVVVGERGAPDPRFPRRGDFRGDERGRMSNILEIAACPSVGAGGIEVCAMGGGEIGCVFHAT